MSHGLAGSLANANTARARARARRGAAQNDGSSRTRTIVRKYVRKIGSHRRGSKGFMNRMTFFEIKEITHIVSYTKIDANALKYGF